VSKLVGCHKNKLTRTVFNRSTNSEGGNNMKCLLPAIFCFSILISNVIGQTQIRKQFGTMTTAKLSSIPDFVLPAIYKDRTAHPLPAVVNHETDAGAKTFCPPLNWCIDGWSCANAAGVSFCYDYAVQTYANTPSSGNSPLYTYNYTYHFLNSANQAEGGDGWMFVEAFDILKQTGCPTSTDFGGFDGAVDDANAWMTGYDKYYKAMKIRVDEYYKIDMSSASADELVKQIVYDYADGSANGAMVCFQANSESMPTSQISGRKTLTSLGGGGGHALTITGYDNSFQGGSWLCQAHWGTGDYWCPYSLLRSGTAWNNNPAGNKYAMFCRVKKNYSPKFTFKVNLTHNQRNNICIMTGVASSPTATTPTKTKDYQGAFNYGGGSLPMCGTGKSSTIEIGLDLTDFQADVSSGQGTFFLTVISKGGTGQVNTLALEDYTGTTVKEIPCSVTNKAISGTITLAVPWTGTISTSIDAKQTLETHPNNGLQATIGQGSHSILFNFPAAGVRNARLTIRSVLGQNVYSKSINQFSGTTAFESWNMKDNLGQSVANGTYIVSVDVRNLSGTIKQYVTKVFVRN